MEFLRQHQLNLMLIMSGICGVLALFVFVTKTLKPKRRRSLLVMEASAMLLLVADRYAYIYRGNITTIGFWMVRICNFLVFGLSLVILYSLTMYIIDLYTSDGGLEKVPRRLQLSRLLAVCGITMLIISQFTGFYYTFDETNRYQRASGFLICYLMPFAIMILDLSVILQYCRRINRSVLIPLILFITLPMLATIAQIFSYGLSLTNLTLVGAAVMFYIFVLLDQNRTVERATKREIELLKEEQQHMRTLFEQTAEALANAIDAKDPYTHGHSTRVADYSKKIARKSGLSEKECDEVYYAALLHDVGKIGVPSRIINKQGKLTDEEYAAIKAHPVIGWEILQGIHNSPYLAVGAHYHHERYDGRGYPEGLQGEAIPLIARIIAVADSYDAMTSKRSYRSPLPQQTVRAEIERGVGSQFDPRFARTMLAMIDEDDSYSMREQVTKAVGRADRDAAGAVFASEVTADEDFASEAAPD